MSYLKMTEFETDRLVYNDDYSIRMIAAKYIALTIGQMKWLSLDEEWTVRVAIANRSDLTPEIIELLSRNKCVCVRLAIEDNPHAQKMLN